MNNNRQTINGHTFTVPAPDLYPFQWLWDSCFHAFFLSKFDLKQAKAELSAVVGRPTASGMFPHIINWNYESGEPLPVPSWGREGRGEEINLTWQTPGNSSQTQPPLVATAALKVFKQDPDIVFLRSLYGALRQHFTYLANERTFTDESLVYIINPDESGEDNSPRFDNSLGLPPQHSPAEHLDKRLGLLHQFAVCDYSASSCMSSHFGVADVAFNVLYAEDLVAMAEIAHLIGYPEESKEYVQRAAEVQVDVLTNLRQGDIFFSYDRVKSTPIAVLTWNIFMPLYGGFVTQAEAEVLVREYLFNPKYFWTDYGVVTTAKTEVAFDPENGFWRGSIWHAPHWFIYHGLKRYGYLVEAELIKQKSLKLIEQSGFREYYHPETGAGLGAKNFTWGGLVLDMD